LTFTPPGGEVEVLLVRQGDAVVLTVRDTGVGIAEDEQEHLFERFFRVPEATRRAVAGAGLGLTVCKSSPLAPGIAPWRAPRGSIARRARRRRPAPAPAAR
jgi:signal transduction histidine kinase